MQSKITSPKLKASSNFNLNRGYLDSTPRPSYQEKLWRTEWKVRSLQIKKRDGFKCRNCQKSDGLNVHHRQYHILKQTGLHKDPWNYSDNLLITLCRICHESGHKNYKVPTFVI